jgi:hypothetical protein
MLRLYGDEGFVFCSRNGTPMTLSNLRRAVRQLCERAGLDRGWTTYELRHSFVSLVADQLDNSSRWPTSPVMSTPGPPRATAMPFVPRCRTPSKHGTGWGHGELTCQPRDDPGPEARPGCDAGWAGASQRTTVEPGFIRPGYRTTSPVPGLFRTHRERPLPACPDSARS